MGRRGSRSQSGAAHARRVDSAGAARGSRPRSLPPAPAPPPSPPMRAAFFDLDRGLLRPHRPWLAWRRAFRDPRPELSDRLRRGATELLAEHRRKGHFTVLLTAGPAAWGERAVQTLAADGVLLAPEGTDPASAHWRCAAVQSFCARYDFAPAVSYGYGAQAEDWLWLEILGYAAVIPPVRDLRRLARASAWAELDLNRGWTGAPGHSAPPL